jgi:hypothetical protein
MPLLAQRANVPGHFAQNQKLRALACSLKSWIIYEFSARMMG